MDPSAQSLDDQDNLWAKSLSSFIQSCATDSEEEAGTSDVPPSYRATAHTTRSGAKAARLPARDIDRLTNSPSDLYYPVERKNRSNYSGPDRMGTEAPVSFM